MGRPLEERFWEKVDKSGGPEACWPWVGATCGDKMGYGRFVVVGNRDRRKLARTHRVAAQLAIGPVEGKVVRHTCDNPPCCNPAHLLIGTQAENVRDRVERGRSATLRGEQNGSSKLSAEQVREIRGLLGTETQTEIARRFGVNLSTVHLIAKGRNWAWLA